jgi:hypothetical protein
MTHCTMDDLLALQANEGSVWAKQHLAACPACRAELEALYQRVARLKALPARRPARDRWPAVREALRAAERGRRRRWGLWSLALAAGVAALIVFRPFASAPADAGELAQVKRQSAALESDLSQLAPDGRVMSGREAAVASLLEDRIALVDGELVRLGLPEAAAPVADVLDLWRERVDLMRQLYTVRVTRAAYVGL